ncbi:hypothetical protein N836_31605 [Leptolyngbya sp. Heron Island J]|uniref:hypothetical protein n=1 Tax=Leptolyngbya sp. Heron Island J TaxID=1385935 RepID=UPI0003B993BF|nr:hypothetical protein [Leptolyngbya sp. Heron Island J]ESA38488.1 hypothetical protein N836_31605 [Leptolyngbya sp. Heron Island J]
MDDFTTIIGSLAFGECDLDEAIATAKQRQQRRQQILRNAKQPDCISPKRYLSNGEIEK